ncbi:MAG: sulfite exporter TauE/SafE family protein [Ideonella sp.]
MNSTLWLSALLMGLVGGPHCLAMCGGACAALAGRCGGQRPRRALLAWQFGRLLAYSAAGAAAASSVALLGDWGRQLAWLRPWWLMLHLGALALGAWMLWQGRAPAWLGGTPELAQAAGRSQKRSAVLQPALAWAMVDGPRPAAAGAGSEPGNSRSASARRRDDHWMQAAAAGLAWVALPCGLLHAALLTAALGSTAVDGAVAMALFAIGSGVSLWLGPSLWIALTRYLPGHLSSHRGWRRLQAFGPVQATRVAGALLAAASGWAVWQAVLGPAIDAFCA